MNGPPTLSPSTAIALLRRGGFLAHPTGTVYGVGCLLRDGPLTELRRAKRGPDGDRPFLLLVPDLAWIRSHFDLPEPLGALATRFWPGPLTIVASPRQPSAFSTAVRSGEGGVAVRVTAHPVTAAMVRALGEPMTSTSANLPGAPAAADAEGAAAALEALGLVGEAGVLAGGTLPGGAPSTIVRMEGDTVEVVREGAIPGTEIQQQVGRAI